MSTPPEDIPAVILAGGRSTRMGGGDKALVELGGRPLIGHVIERLRPQAGPLAINANGDPARFENFGLPVIADTVAGFAGPLAGVLCAMEWAARNDSRLVVTVAGDTPFLPADLVARLSRGAGEKITLAASGGRTHPVIGLWPTSLHAELARHLAGGGSRKVTAFTGATGFSTVEFEPAEGGPDPFFNINSPDDLAFARAYAEIPLP